MVAEYASADVVVALDDYINHPEHGLTKEQLADIFPGYIATNTFEEYGGKMLSFPFTKSNLMMYFNLDIIRKAGFEDRPKTWKEFLAQCRAIRKMTGRPAYALSVDPSTIDGMVYSFGGELYVREGEKRRALFDSEASLKTFGVIETLAKEKLAFQINPGTYDDRDALAAERVAFMMRSSTSRPYLHDMIKDRFAWGLSEIPHAEGVKPVTVMFGANICMFKSTPEKELAAWKFIKYFASPKVTALWATETGYLPVRRSALNEEPYKSFANAHPRNRAAFDVIPIARPEPNLAGWQEIRKHLDRAETSVVTGMKTAAEAAAELAEKSNKVLAR
jgi:ABC-type glycerol-3-phosphate transport system substrate-binding protein